MPQLAEEICLFGIFPEEQGLDRGILFPLLNCYPALFPFGLSLCRVLTLDQHICTSQMWYSPRNRTLPQRESRTLHSHLGTGYQ